MTNLVLNTKKLEIEVMPLKEAKFGKWYRIAEYKHNESLVGEVGVLSHTYCADIPYTLVSPSGNQFSHPDIFLQEIQNVEVICS